MESTTLFTHHSNRMFSSSARTKLFCAPLRLNRSNTEILHTDTFMCTEELSPSLISYKNKAAHTMDRVKKRVSGRNSVLGGGVHTKCITTEEFV